MPRPGPSGRAWTSFSLYHRVLPGTLFPAGSFREYFLRCPLCTGYQPSFKITIIIAKATTTICWWLLIARHRVRFLTYANTHQRYCYFPHFAEENMGWMFNDELPSVKERRSQSGSCFTVQPAHKSPWLLRRWTQAPAMIHLLSSLDSVASCIPSPLPPYAGTNTWKPGQSLFLGHNLCTASFFSFHPTW